MVVFQKDAEKTLGNIHKNVYSRVPFKIARLWPTVYYQTNNSFTDTFLEVLKKESIRKGKGNHKF